MKILIKKDLDQRLAEGCKNPGCTHEHEKMSELFLHSLCHVGYGVEVCYNAEGFLIITCHFCNQEIAHIAVGD